MFIKLNIVSKDYIVILDKYHVYSDEYFFAIQGINKAPKNNWISNNIH